MMMSEPTANFEVDSFELLSLEGREQFAKIIDDSLKIQLPLSEDDESVTNIQRLLSSRLACKTECKEDQNIQQYKSLASAAVTIFTNSQQNRLHSPVLSILRDSLFILQKDVSSKFADDAIELCLLKLHEDSLKEDDIEQTKLFLNLLDNLLSFSSEKNLTILTKVQDLALQIIYSGCDSLSSFAISSLLPRVLNANPEIVAEIWQKLLISKHNQSNLKLTPYCLLLALILSVENPNVTFLHQNQFWELIQQGLNSRDQMTRKQARFMLKRALDFVNTRKISIACSQISWTPQMSNLEMWDNFFLVIETLEEKQVHIIKPVLHLIEKLFTTTGPQWAFLALSQVVGHDNIHIVKWGLEFFFSLSPCTRTSQFFLENVIPALDHTPLYFESDLAERLEIFAQKSAAAGDVSLFKQILSAVIDISWGPVPLFVICNALRNLPRFKVWDSVDLDQLKHLLVNAMSTQDVFLRATAQSMLLRATLSLVDVSKITIESWIDLLASFNRKESLARGLRDWQLLVEFIKATPDVQFAPSDFMTKVSSKAAARYLLLLSDAEVLKKETVGELALDFECSLQQLETRLYCASTSSKNQVDHLLELIVQMHVELGQHNDWENSILDRLLRPKSLQGIFGYVCLKLQTEQNEEQDLVLLYINCLQLFERTGTAKMIDAEKIVFCAQDILEAEGKDLMSKYFAAKVIEHFSASKSHNSLSSLLKEVIGKRALSGSMNNVQFTDRPTTFEHREHRNKIVSGILNSNWIALLALLEAPSSPLTLPQETILNLAEDAVEMSGPETLPSVMLCLRHCLSQEKDALRVEKLLNKTYLKCFEHRKSELFWLDIKAFIKMAFDAQMMERSDLKDCLLKLTESLHEHSQTVAGLFNLVIDNLIEQTSSVIFSHQMCLALLFGPTFRKDQKILNDLSLQIMSQGEEVPANTLIGSNCQSSQVVRSKAIQLLLASDTDHSSLAELLIQKDVELSSNKKLRYFAESQVHRTKHRIAQSLLLIGCLTKDKLVNQNIFSWATNSLANENHQPSVRYLIEWLLSLILLNNSCFGDKFFENVKEAASRRLNSIPSFVSVLYLWIIGLAKDGSRNLDLTHSIKVTIDLLLPWCMAQNYNIRLYAQVALLRIFTLCEHHQFEHHVASLSTLKSGIRSSVEQSSGVKNAVKLQEDFFFSVFDPISHLTLETILVEFPRLTNVGQDEWLSIKFFASHNYPTLPIKVTNTDDSLAKSKVANWILKATGVLTDVENTDESSYSVVQRKVTPWSDMFPENCARVNRTPPLGGLVVVASLVDKPPNLGGLSRTCEIFGASQLIIGNMKIVDDPAFQSLSVTAEKWINLSEVKVEDLVEYLQFMKKQGYVLMAAEQTSKSEPLQNVKFNKKSLILLGNEKEGIPAELLPYLDVCVEIPQMGVIRSLNVHVTGALFVWQYFQQHHLTCTAEK